VAVPAGTGSQAEEQRVLLYRLPPELDRTRTGLLARPEFTVDRADAPDDLLRRLDSTPYKVLILRLPDEGVDAVGALAHIRGEGRPCARGIFILLTTAARIEEYRPHLGRGLNAILPETATPAALEAEITRQVQVLPRLDTRCAVRMKAELKGGPAGICQTRDLSASGMFLICRGGRAVGESIRFELILPSTRIPLAGTGMVVRQAVPGRERYEGFAVAFTSFAPGSREALRGFLDWKMAGV
jgi:CheY-like chemotaxis protein